MGIRPIRPGKANSLETAFYLLNAYESLACEQPCFLQGREPWASYFGSNGYMYASDFWLALFIDNPD